MKLEFEEFLYLLTKLNINIEDPITSKIIKLHYTSNLKIFSDIPNLEFIDNIIDLLKYLQIPITYEIKRTLLNTITNIITIKSSDKYNNTKLAPLNQIKTREKLIEKTLLELRITPDSEEGNLFKQVILNLLTIEKTINFKKLTTKDIYSPLINKINPIYFKKSKNKLETINTIFKSQITKIEKHLKTSKQLPPSAQYIYQNTPTLHLGVKDFIFQLTNYIKHLEQEKKKNIIFEEKSSYKK